MTFAINIRGKSSVTEGRAARVPGPGPTQHALPLGRVTRQAVRIVADHRAAAKPRIAFQHRRQAQRALPLGIILDFICG